MTDAHDTMTDEQVAMVLEAAEAAAQWPEHHRQSMWLHIAGAFTSDEHIFALGERPPCGSTLCFAGWVTFLNAPRGSVISLNGRVRLSSNGLEYMIPDYVREITGLSDSQAGALFYGVSDAGLLPAARCLAANRRASDVDLMDAQYDPQYLTP